MSNPFGYGSSYVPYNQQQSYSQKGAPLAGNVAPNLYQGTAPNPYQLNWNPGTVNPVGLDSARLNPIRPEAMDFAAGMQTGRMVQMPGSGDQVYNVDYTRNPYESIYKALENATSKQQFTPGKNVALPQGPENRIDDKYFEDARARSQRYSDPKYRSAQGVLDSVKGLSLDQLKNLTYQTPISSLFQGVIGDTRNLYANPLAASQMGSNWDTQRGLLESAYGHLMDQMKQYYLY